ncbi:phage integrase family protein [Desulfitobacterium dehalogenans ATCC 51507]|uniref:Phage integrase family protein n=2 Tax=Desulfitobacterium dehalogenans TaxID=36854 RepID=I4A9Y7_DESDJ|nr:phage integrase family protein [Desulfitobacterium dehalogenans ATCC 51507]
MWEYMNDDINDFNVEVMGYVSDLRRMQGEPSLMDDFARIMGVKTYTKFTNDQALKWTDIDFESRLVDISKSWQYIPGKGSFEKLTKNKSSNRKVRLSASTIFLLRQLKGEQESNAEERGTKWVDSGAVFTAWNGKQVNAVWASCWWRGWIKKTGLPIKHFTASGTPVSAC